MKIIIPTKGRVDNQITYGLLPTELRLQTIFVCPAEELSAHIDRGRRTMACLLPGVPAARQLAMDEFKHEDVIVMLDDDLRFHIRKPDWVPGLGGEAIATTEDIIDMFAWLTSQEYAMMGVSAKGFNNGRGTERNHEEINDRIMRCFAFRPEVLISHQIRWDVFPYWEDFHVVLSLLKLGYANIVSYLWSNNSVTNTKGGVDRTREGLLACREDFVRYHAPYAVPVEKQAKSWGWGTAPDLKISWKKAARHSL